VVSECELVPLTPKSLLFPYSMLLAWVPEALAGDTSAFLFRKIIIMPIVLSRDILQIKATLT
jgi:hypothetical protein